MHDAPKHRPSPIKEGPQWLQHPGVRALLNEHGLDGVTVECVGKRRSFTGKAWPHRDVVRMVCTGVHPLEWLVVFLHELAHVADYRERQRQLSGDRRFEKATENERRRLLWALDRPHGKLWSRHFERLVQSAITSGFFPGNERAVLAHARSGAATVHGLRLNYAADPHIAFHEAVSSDTDQHHKAAKDSSCLPQRTPPAEQFSPGEWVQFQTPDGAQYRGRIVRVNKKTCTVKTPSGSWRVSFALLHKSEEN